MAKQSQEILKTPMSVKDSALLFDFSIIIRLILTFIIGFLTVKIAFPTLVLHVFNYIISPVSIVIAILLLLTKGKTFADLKKIIIPTRPDLNSVLATVLITIGMFFGLSKLNDLFISFLTNLGLHSGQEVSVPDKTFLGVTISLLFICTLPAFFEELLFRGFIVSGLKNAGEVFAIILTGVLFSLSHMNPAQTLYQLAVGVLYAMIAVRGGNYLLTFLSHLLNNILIILNYYFWGFAPTGIFAVLLTIIGLISLASGVILLIKNKKNTPVTESKTSFVYGAPIGIVACLILWIVGLFA